MRRQLKRHDQHNTAGPHGKENYRLQVELEIVRGQARNMLRPVQVPAFLIGSADDCDLVLGDPQFPDLHSYLRVEAQRVTLRYLGFQPALTLNGLAVTTAELTQGDRIRSGPYEFLVHIRSGATQRDPLDYSDLDFLEEFDPVEDEVGCDKVQALLREVRNAVFPASTTLRLYSGPEQVRSISRMQTMHPMNHWPAAFKRAGNH
jgi:hypothetical protein